MRILLSVSIVVLFMLSSPPANGFDSWKLYDNFNSHFLDIAKWGESQARSGGVVVLEDIREIDDESLYILNRAHGPTQAGVHRGDKSLVFSDPDSIRGVKFSVKVDSLKITQCPDSGVQPTRARARFSGSFFNTGGCGPIPTSCGGQANDVAAQILIQRFSDSTEGPGILRILGEVFECTDSSCFQVANYQSVELGTVKVGQWVTVSVVWDYLNKQFIFQVGYAKPQKISYLMPVNSLPNAPYKLIGLSPRIPYCPSQRQVVLTGAEFENVFVK